MPAVGSTVSAGAVVGMVESVKAQNDVVSPVSGEVHIVNDELTYSPELINEDPYGDGWMFCVRVQSDVAEALNAAELMSADEYAAFIAGDS